MKGDYIKGGDVLIIVRWPLLPHGVYATLSCVCTCLQVCVCVRAFYPHQGRKHARARHKVTAGRVSLHHHLQPPAHTHPAY